MTCLWLFVLLPLYQSLFACCETPLFPSMQGYPFLHAEMIHLHLTADSFSQTVDSADYKASIPRFVQVFSVTVTLPTMLFTTLSLPISVPVTCLIKKKQFLDSLALASSSVTLFLNSQNWSALQMGCSYRESLLLLASRRVITLRVFRGHSSCTCLSIVPVSILIQLCLYLQK